MDEAYEETGWKLVHGDIFRPPQHRAFFVANLGAGIQLIAMSVSFERGLGKIWMLKLYLGSHSAHCNDGNALTFCSWIFT